MGTHWQFQSGTYSLTLSNLSSFSTSLSTYDKNAAVNITDYNHTLIWLGTIFSFSTGDSSGYIQLFVHDPSPSTGWVKCLGQNVQRLLGTGVLDAVETLPVISGAYAVALAPYGSSVNIVNSAVNPSLTPVSETQTQIVSSGTGVTVPAHPHTHLDTVTEGFPASIYYKGWYRL
jgi:hypothetical protein